MPPYSPVFSALGAGNTPQMHIHERTAPMALYDAMARRLFDDYERFNLIVEELEDKGRADLLRQGLPADAVRHRLELDMRYGDQMVTVAVVADRTRLSGPVDVMALIELFAQDYGRRYGEGSQSPEAGIRISTIRVASHVPTGTVKFDAALPDGTPEPAVPVSSRRCHFVGFDTAVDTPVYDENALRPGLVVHGPAVVTAAAPTYLVEPGWRLQTGAHGAIWFLTDAGDSR
ncbi:hypothetical protein [Streptosporangium sp. KLBMP 9127]|nr:hypothetical protein [Streptosporangium sp. KLBMP 9127]